MTDNKKQIAMILVAVTVMIVFLIVFEFFVFDRGDIFDNKQVDFYDKQYESLSRMKVDVFNRKEFSDFKNIQLFNAPNGRSSTKRNINIFQNQ